MSTNGIPKDDFPNLITRDEMIEFATENQDMFNGIRIDLAKFGDAHNTVAEACMLNRFLLEKFMPAPQLAAAIAEYRARREAMIAEDAAREAALAAAPGAHGAN